MQASFCGASFNAAKVVFEQLLFLIRRSNIQLHGLIQQPSSLPRNFHATSAEDNVLFIQPTTILGGASDSSRYLDNVPMSGT